MRHPSLSINGNNCTHYLHLLSNGARLPTRPAGRELAAAKELEPLVSRPATPGEANQAPLSLRISAFLPEEFRV
jgi:hypothetical protein